LEDFPSPKVGYGLTIRSPISPSSDRNGLVPMDYGTAHTLGKSLKGVLGQFPDFQCSRKTCRFKCTGPFHDPSLDIRLPPIRHLGIQVKDNGLYRWSYRT